MEPIRLRKEELSEKFYCFAIAADKIQHLTSILTRSGYISDNQGWCADVFTVGSVALITGYRPFGVHVPEAFVYPYDMEAKTAIEIYADPEPEIRKILIDMCLGLLMTRREAVS